MIYGLSFLYVIAIIIYCVAMLSDRDGLSVAALIPKFAR